MPVVKWGFGFSLFAQVAGGLGVVGWGSGSGVAGPKSWCVGCEPVALDAESFPGCSPGPCVLALVVRASARRAA